MQSSGIMRHVTLNNLIFLLSTIMFAWLCWYFYTGFGGPSELAAALVPMALMLQLLLMHRRAYLYKRLPPVVNNVIILAYMGICVFAFYHFMTEFEDISIWRQGSYTRADFIMGLLVFMLVMEISRLAHTELFWVNVVLVVYTLYGYLSPIDFFWHPGTTFYRLITSSTVELSTGIYGQVRSNRADHDRGLPAAGRRGARLRRAECDGPVHAPDRGQIAVRRSRRPPSWPPPRSA